MELKAVVPASAAGEPALILGIHYMELKVTLASVMPSINFRNRIHYMELKV